MEEVNGPREREWPSKDADFEELALVAFYFHPSLDLARAQWAVTRASTKTAAARPNPTISAQPAYNFSAAGGASPWMPGLTLDWPIETAGKRGHRIHRATLLAEVARQNILHSAWQVRANVRTALLDLSGSSERAVLLQRQLTIGKALKEALEQRLKAGSISSLEIAPVQLAYLKSSGELADAKRLATEARSRLAEALGLPLAALDGWDLRLDLSSGVSETAEPSAQALHRAALQNRADVQGLLAEYAASEVALQLEIARQYPDIRLGSGYQWDQGDNKWALSVTMELPILNRNQGPIAESFAHRAEVATRFAALQAHVVAEVDRSLAHQRAAREQLVTAMDLLRKHAHHLEAMRSAFRAGAVDQVEVRTAEVEAAAAELIRLDALSRLQQALGEQQQAIQAPFHRAALLERARPNANELSEP